VNVTVNQKAVNAGYVRSLLGPRKKDSNKGDYGHVLVLAGSRGMSGAAVLCTHGALRSGAGLVSLGIPESQQEIITARLRPEAMTVILPERSGRLSSKAVAPVREYVEKRKVTSLAVGPGLGNDPEVYRLVKRLLSALTVPLVLDADGLNVIAKASKRKDLAVQDLLQAKAPLVVTPHPGEFSRLTGIPVSEIQKHRVELAVNFARANGIVCVLKGYHTVITDGYECFINTTGNPGMAAGGTGDVLTGIIAALAAQVKEPRLIHAAVAGVFLHGAAGDKAAREKTEISMLAGDIIEMLPYAFGKK